MRNPIKNFNEFEKQMEEQGIEVVLENDSPAFPKQEPFYCCICKKNTDGLNTCHLCGHIKGRWKTDGDGHHCLRENEK